MGEGGKRDRDDRTGKKKEGEGERQGRAVHMTTRERGKYHERSEGRGGNDDDQRKEKREGEKGEEIDKHDMGTHLEYAGKRK